MLFIQYSRKSLAPWVQGPIKLNRSRFRSAYLKCVHLSAFAISLAFAFTADEASTLLIALISGLVVVGSALYYWKYESQMLSELHFDGVYWQLKLVDPRIQSGSGRPDNRNNRRKGRRFNIGRYSIGRYSIGRDKVYRAELVRDSSVTYRGLYCLTFRTLAGKTIRTDLWWDQLTRDEFRRLYVVLNWI